eukprot:58073-Chlamydomonas_euryale.AAC.7
MLWRCGVLPVAAWARLWSRSYACVAAELVGRGADARVVVTQLCICSSRPQRLTGGDSMVVWTNRPVTHARALVDLQRWCSTAPASGRHCVPLQPMSTAESTAAAAAAAAQRLATASIQRGATRQWRKRPVLAGPRIPARAGSCGPQLFGAEAAWPAAPRRVPGRSSSRPPSRWRPSCPPGWRGAPLEEGAGCSLPATARRDATSLVPRMDPASSGGAARTAPRCFRRAQPRLRRARMLRLRRRGTGGAARGHAHACGGVLSGLGKTVVRDPRPAAWTWWIGGRECGCVLLHTSPASRRRALAAARAAEHCCIHAAAGDADAGEARRVRMGRLEAHQFVRARVETRPGQGLACAGARGRRMARGCCRWRGKRRRRTSPCE